MKKILSFILCLALVAGVFYGCSSDKKGEENNLKLSFTYDSAYKNYDESVIRAYQTVCKAIVNYDDEVRINVGMRERIQQLLYTSFPLIDLVDKLEEKKDGSGLSVTYKNDEATHKQNIADFEKIICDIQTQCKMGQVSKTEYVIRVYNYVSSHITVSDDMTVSTYQTIVGGKGTSFTYANLFEYLLLQSDIEAFHVLGEDASKTGWGLSGAVIDSNFYYFDVMSEFYANKGTQLLYFGMTSDDVKNEGLRNLMYSDKTKAADASELEFDVCRQCVSWKIADNKLLITRADNKTVEIEI